VAAALVIVVGYVPSGAAGALLDPTGSGAFLGLWLQFVDPRRPPPDIACGCPKLGSRPMPCYFAADGGRA
jgi:hypothetical protein